ncbi:MAG: TetR/AcrR family transcriptional regulator C-terminal domain-containing protein [Halioglobus sp.]
MAKPLIGVETIYNTALRILDEQGSEALSVRNLAAALQCSTRTLYQQVGKREELLRQLLDFYFAHIQLDFSRQASWQESSTSWAHAMRSALLAHPNLSRHLTVENRTAIADYVNQLLRVLLEHAFPEELALRSARVLTHTVIGLVLAEIDTPPAQIRRKRRSSKEIEFEDLVIARSGKTANSSEFQDSPEVFSTAVNWLVRGMESELEGSAGER